MAQLLSQSHDANYIQFWLTSWFADLKKPDEVIIDGSEALIGRQCDHSLHMPVPINT